MPGVFGIFSDGDAGECARTLSRMGAAMYREPFYISAALSDSEQGVYAGLVSLSGKGKPSGWVTNETNDITLLFSGECRPDRDRIAALRAAGHVFSRDNPDWLVHEYEEAGPGIFGRINGLFSGLLIDKRQRKTFLFCDRYGISRLYSARTPWGTLFSNEAKPLLSVLPETRRFNPPALNEYLAFGFTTGDQTLFQNIKVVKPGSLWTYQKGNLLQGSFFKLETWRAQSELDSASFEKSLSEILARIVPEYFDGEEPVGVSLTGGLDTRLVLAHQGCQHPRAVTYTFDACQSNTLDTRIASKLAERCGLPHHRVEINGDFFRNFGTHADATVLATDGCHGVLGAHEIYLNRKARALAQVRLTGVFGGEILRGVSTFKPLELARDFISGEVRARVYQRACAANSEGEHPVVAAAFTGMPAALYGSLTACRSQVMFRTPFLDNELVGLVFRAPLETLRSASPSLRAIHDGHGRLLDIPTDRGRTEGRLRQLYLSCTFKLDYLANEGFPNILAPLDAPLFRLGKSLGLLGQHKYLSYRRWLRHELAPFLCERLCDPELERLSFLDSRKVAEMAKDHVAGKRNYTTELHLALTLQAIDRLLLRDWPAPARKEVGAESHALQA